MRSERAHLPIRSVGPPKSRIRVGVEITPVIELLLRRLRELFCVHREAWYWQNPYIKVRCDVPMIKKEWKRTELTLALCPAELKHFALVERIVRGWPLRLVCRVHGYATLDLRRMMVVVGEVEE